MAVRKPKLLYAAEVRRAPYLRRFAWSFLAAVAALGAVAALDVAAGGGLADATVLTVGIVAGMAAVVLFAVRALFSLWCWLRRRSEELRFYDRGFVWERRDGEHKYRWSQLETFREGGRSLYFRQRPLLQWGALWLTMQDGKVFKITGAHGDLRRIASALRRPIAYYTGIQMGRKLRAEQPIRVHRQLALWPGGLEVGKHEIPWAELDVRLRNRRLVILRRGQSGKFKPVRQYRSDQVNNLDGFLELATTTIRNHQRERFARQREA